MEDDDLPVDNFVSMLRPVIRNVLGTNTRMSNRQQINKILVDIVQEEKIIYIYAEIPGVNKEDIDVDFYNNKLTITVERTRVYNEPNVSEIRYGRYERTLTLPICVTKREAVNVSYANGILKIKINKLLEEENKFSIKPSE